MAGQSGGGTAVSAHGGEERRRLGDKRGEGYLGLGKIGRKDGPHGNS